MSAVEHLKTLCCLGLPPESAMMAVTPLLHEIIPHGWTRIGVFGAESGIPAGGWSEHPETAKIYRERHTQILREPGPGPLLNAEWRAVGIGWTLHAQGRGWLDTAWYREIEAPLDARWVLDAMIGEGRRTHAALALTRPSSARPFNADDVERLAPLRRWLAHAFRPAAPGGLGHWDQDKLGIAGLALLRGELIVTASGDVVHQTRAAEHLLVTLKSGAHSAALHPLIAKLVQRIVGAANGSLCEPPRTKIATPYGVHTVEAKWLIPAGASPTDVAKDPKGCLIAVSIELHEHPVAHAARVLRASGATPTQVKVGVKLALGKTKPEIADELGVKPSSVADLTRKLYQTLDVHNSAELGARIWLS